MIAVLASGFDEPVKRAVSKWHPGDDVVRLTVDDLLSPGWSVRTDDVMNSKFVAQGRIWSAQDLTGMVNLMRCVYDFEMFRIRRRDRSYVGSEIFAFLVWWLRELPCPVLNRPTAGCLTGPSWRAAQWVQACSRADIPALPLKMDSLASLSQSLNSTDEKCTTTVVCGQTYGNVYSKECRILAGLAGTDYLDVIFHNEGERWIFHGVNLVPALHRAEVRNMLATAFLYPIELRHGTAMGIARG